MAKTLQNNVLNYLGVRATDPSETLALPSAPNSSFTNYDLYTFGVFNNSLYFLSSFSGTGANWILLGSGAGAIESVLGTANQITATPSGTTVTLSLPSAITAPGSLTVTSGFTVSAGTTAITGTTNINTSGSAVSSIGTGGTGAVNIGNATGNTAVTGSLTASTSLTATLGNITATNGNLSLSTAGNKIVIATGSNASVGTSGAMSGSPGAVTVATTASSATATIFYSRAATGGTPGEVSITAQGGTGFTLTSTGNETSTFNWWIINA